MHIIDVQLCSYKSDVQYIKELACLDTVTQVEYCHIIPYENVALNEKVMYHMSYLERTIHGLPFEYAPDECRLSLVELQKKLQRTIGRNEDILVQTRDKRNAIRKLLPNHPIIVVSDWISNRICRNTMYHCKKHTDNTLRCALENVHIMYNEYWNATHARDTSILA